MVVTIDGPAGAGKSTIARQLAASLGFRFLDTGAMYRAVTWLAMEHQIDWQDATQLAELAKQAQIVVEPDHVEINGSDVTQAIRTREVTENIHWIANEPLVRQQLVAKQREVVGNDDVVTEGRDQGTAAFPNADYKFYLTASPSERARRRQRQLEQDNISVDFDELLEEQDRRDRRDASRSVGPLVQPEDAIELNSDSLSTDQVVRLMREAILGSEQSSGQR